MDTALSEYSPNHLFCNTVCTHLESESEISLYLTLLTGHFCCTHTHAYTVYCCLLWYVLLFVLKFLRLILIRCGFLPISASSKLFIV